MPKYEVTVVRSCSASRVIEVEASCEMEAREMAIDDAGDYEFREKEADYEVDNTTLIEEKEDVVPQLGRKYWCRVGDGAFPGRHGATAVITDKGWPEARNLAIIDAEVSLGPGPKQVTCTGVQTLVMNEPEWPVDVYIDCTGCDNCETLAAEEQRHHAKLFDLLHAFGLGDSDDNPDIWEIGVYRCHECGTQVLSKIEAAEFFEKEKD